MSMTVEQSKSYEVLSFGGQKFIKIKISLRRLAPGSKSVNKTGLDSRLINI